MGSVIASHRHTKPRSIIVLLLLLHASWVMHGHRNANYRAAPSNGPRPL